jgi:transcriptional regulator with XRE-family HTH domain
VSRSSELTRSAARVSYQADLDEDRLRSVFGSRVREARKRRGLSGRELAALAGVTHSFISQIENGQVTPAVSKMLRISHALGIPMAELFEIRRPSTGHVLTPEEWALYSDDGVTEDAVLALDPDRGVELVWTRFPARKEHDSQRRANDAPLQVVFVLRGQVELAIGDEQHVLGEQSCVTFDGRTARSWSNSSSEPAEILSFLFRSSH